MSNRLNIVVVGDAAVVQEKLEALGVGPVVRLVDKISDAVGEVNCESHTVVQEHLGVATEEMMEWMGVK